MGALLKPDMGKLIYLLAGMFLLPKAVSMVKSKMG